MNVPIDRAALEKAIATGERWQTADYRETAIILLDAARAHLATLPKTMMFSVWRVEYAQGGFPYSASFHTRIEADRYEATVRNWGDTSCIRVTGPHQQEVPA